MDTLRFHAQATRPAAKPPDLTHAQLSGLSMPDLVTHVNAVTDWAASAYLDTTHTQALQAELDMTVHYNQAALPGSKSILGVSGPNGAGKSTLCRQWAWSQYRRLTKSAPIEDGLPFWEPSSGVRADLAPVVWTNLQANSRIAEVDAQILSFLGVGLSGTIRDMTLRAVRAIARHGVRILVIDDVHLLKTTHRNGRDVLDHVKHLNTELGEHQATLVLIGADLRRTDLLHDPQIAARLRLVELEAIPPAQGSRGAWLDVVQDFEATLMPLLPAARPGVLAEHSDLLHHLTGGYLGELATLLKHATILATMQRTGTITHELLDAVPRSYRAINNAQRQPRTAQR